jgi:hypothetical protein
MAREEMPVSWEQHDELIVTREALDDPAAGAPTPRPRAPRRSYAHERPASANDEITPARVAWEGGLTLRQRILRAAAIGLLITLTLYLLLGGPAATRATLDSVSAALDARLHPPKPQPTLAERGYISVKSPPGAYNLPEISIAPFTGEANAAWACWASPYSPKGQRGVWSAQAFYTANGGAHWTPLALPYTAAQNCSISADRADASSALIILSQGLAPDGSCIAPFLYLTNDTGASWRHVPWPIGPSDGACRPLTALEGGAIYIWSDKPLVRGTTPSLAPTGRFIVSRDAGQTWALADTGLDDSAGLDIVGFRTGGHILATIADTRSSSDASILMTSDDYGASWRTLGDLPGAFPQVFVSNDNTVTDHGGWGRLYELAEAETNGSPRIPAQLYLATAYIGQGWSPISLPPLAPGTATNPQSRTPLVIGLGPGGSLEVERGIVESANAQLSPARRLWVWDPTQNTWLLDPQTIPGNLQLQGATWRAGDQIFWVTTLQLGVPPILQIYTKVYPADLLHHIQQAPTAGP